MQLPIFVYTILICLIVSCKKEETIIPLTNATAIDYLLFKPGTYDGVPQINYEARPVKYYIAE